jgi:predicted small lipoprotein YifL
MKKIPFLTFIVITAALVTHCGQKGGLTRPEQPDLTAFMKSAPT